MMRIEGDIRTRIYPYRYAIDIPPGGRAGLGRTAGGMFRAGFAPHGIRGAFNIFEDQVAIVARLETFMCTDPPRRDPVHLRTRQRAPALAQSCSAFPARTHGGTLVFAFFCFHRVPEMLCFTFTFVNDTP